jgi:tetratricopeptide (TPR) repeat protein
LKDFRFKYLSCALFLLLRTLLFSQDSVEVNRLNEISYLLISRDPDSALVVSKKALALAESANYRNGILEACNNISMSNYNLGNFSEGLASAKRAVEISKAAQNKKQLARAYTNLFLIQRVMADYPGALNSAYEALKIHETNRNRMGIFSSYNNIANVYNDQQNFTKALQYFLKAALYLDSNNAVQKSRLYSNLGLVYTELGDFESSMKYFNEALELRKDDLLGLSDLQVNIGLCYSTQGKFEEALKYFLQAAEIYEEKHRELNLGIACSNIGDCYLHLKKFDRASQYLNKALSIAQKIDDKEGIKVAYNNLSELYAQTGNFEKAFAYNRRFTIFKDSLASQQSQNQISDIQTKYETDKREKEIEWLNKEKTLKDEIIEKQNSQRRLFIGGLILLAGFLIYIFISLRRKHRDNLIISKQKAEVDEQKKMLEDKNKEILDSIHYAQRIQKAFLTSQKYFERNISRLRGKRQE